MARNIKSIPLNLLKLDQENVRFGNDVAKNQREALMLMLSDPDDAKKILKLAEHIAEHGLDPTELQLVTSDNEGGYTVLEGNRRLTALKLLQKPDLCPADKFVKDFRAARDKITGSFPEEFECSLIDSREEGDKWVELKHTGQNAGVGRVDWSSNIRDERRARQTGVESIGRQIRNLIEGNEGYFSPETIEGISKIDVTTLTRLFSSSPAQNTFQLKVEDKILTPCLDMRFIAPSLEFAIALFVSSGYNVNDVRNKDDRNRFLSRIPDDLLPVVLALQDESVEAGPQHDDLPMNADASGRASNRDDEPSNDVPQEVQTGRSKAKRARPSTRDRKRLIPWSLNIENPRINMIYRELRHDLEVEKTPNAVAVTFRVLIELTCDHYTEIQKLEGTPIHRHDNTSALLSIGAGTSLSIKVQAVCAHLLKQGKLTNAESKAVSRRASSQNTIGSVDHFNAFVHTPASSPVPSELKDIADEYRPFFEAIWS